MKIEATTIPDVLIITPTVFSDERGVFYESYNQQRFIQKTGLDRTFVQDNLARSTKGVLRGLHYQIEQTQGKLVQCISGEVFDVSVDLRKSSETFGQWVGIMLSSSNRRQLWIPEGFAHGYLVTSESAEVTYKTTHYWAPQFERTIAWNDPHLNISWPIDGDLLLSEKDRSAASLAQADVFS